MLVLRAHVLQGQRPSRALVALKACAAIQRQHQDSSLAGGGGGGGGGTPAAGASARPVPLPAGASPAKASLRPLQLQQQQQQQRQRQRQQQQQSSLEAAAQVLIRDVLAPAEEEGGVGRGGPGAVQKALEQQDARRLADGLLDCLDLRECNIVCVPCTKSVFLSCS